MKSPYVSLRKNPAGSPENKKMSYPGKGTRFGKHLFITYLKIEYNTVGKVFHLRKGDVISHTADICCCRKRKLGLILTFRNVVNVKK